MCACCRNEKDDRWVAPGVSLGCDDAIIPGIDAWDTGCVRKMCPY